MPNGMLIATTDAKNIVVEAATYVTLSGGLTPTITDDAGNVTTFRNGAEFAAYALSMATAAGQASPDILTT